MKKTPVDNFQYVSLLVHKIKESVKNKTDYDFYFDELVKLHWPFLNAKMKQVFYKLPRETRSYHRVKIKLLEVFFQTIIKYEPAFSNSKKNVKGFTGVYFGSYLKSTMNWDMLRMVYPNKIENDDFALDKRAVELTIDVEDNKQTKPISDNFIALCRKLHKELKDENLADIMILHYGYNWREKEIIKALKIDATILAESIEKINEYWRKNVEVIQP